MKINATSPEFGDEQTGKNSELSRLENVPFESTTRMSGFAHKLRNMGRVTRQAWTGSRAFVGNQDFFFFYILGPVPVRCYPNVFFEDVKDPDLFLFV